MTWVSSPTPLQLSGELLSCLMVRRLPSQGERVGELFDMRAGRCLWSYGAPSLGCFPLVQDLRSFLGNVSPCPSGWFSLVTIDAGRMTTQLGTPRGRYDEHSSKFSLSKKPRFIDPVGKSQT
jgi:hypothetical protein